MIKAIRGCVSIPLLRSVSYAHITTKCFSIEKTKTFKQLSQIKRSPIVMSKFTFSSVNELIVEHNKSNKEFFITLGNDKAMLNYATVSRDVIDLYHTEVPSQLSGRGIAKKLAEKAFDYAVENNLKTRVTCTYLQKYLNDNPNEKYLKNVVK